jgi:hypothetical protein
MMVSSRRRRRLPAFRERALVDEAQSSKNVHWATRETEDSAHASNHPRVGRRRPGRSDGL